MNERNMLYFLTVADEQSISRAAEKLYVSQPSLTQAIQRIEQRLNVTLFKRTSKGLLLTDEGKKLYLTINQVNNLWDDFRSSIIGDDDMKTGRIVINAPAYFGALIVPPVIDVFKQTYPNVDCAVEEFFFHESERRLISGQADVIFAARPDHETTDKIHYEFLFRDSYVLIISAELERSIRDFRFVETEAGRFVDLQSLRDCTFFLPMKGKRSSYIVNMIFEKAGIVVRKAADCSINQLMVEKMVAQGLGCAILPESYIIPDSRIRRYSLPPNYNAYWDICLGTLKGAPRTELLKRFIKITHGLFDNNPPSFSA